MNKVKKELVTQLEEIKTKFDNQYEAGGREPAKYPELYVISWF